jgi:endonuclease YncB( thermonuclease family)
MHRVSASLTFFVFLFGLLTCVAPGAALADVSPAKVIAVSDGDTVTAVTNGGQQREIRLEGIDALEHGSGFRVRAAAHLSALVSGTTVNLDCNGGESYNRLVWKILLPSGEDDDLDQIKAGMAWHYKQYQRLQTATDRNSYGAAEDQARRARIGLWADAQPVQPQDFRHGSHSGMCLDKSDHRIACSDTYEGPVRANKHSGIFHWPGCPNYDDIAEYIALNIRTPWLLRRPGTGQLGIACNVGGVNEATGAFLILSIGAIVFVDIAHV